MQDMIELSREGLRTDIPGFGAGDTIRVMVRVRVERIFPIHSPSIANIEVVRRGRVRRAKLYYLRALSGKAARIREKRDA